MAEPTTTTRRPARCSKHAFAPRASWRPKNDVTGSVTLPAYRHQTCLDRAGLASETAGAGDDPVNGSDPSGLCTIPGDGFLYPGTCARTGAQAIAAENWIYGHSGGGGSLLDSVARAEAAGWAGVGNDVLQFLQPNPALDLPDYNLSNPYPCTDSGEYTTGEDYVGPVLIGASTALIGASAESALDAAAARAEEAAESESSIAEDIANGHAFDKHVVEQGEYPEITNPQQFADLIQDVMDNPTAEKALSGGRYAYWQQSTDTVVITNSADPDGGTALRPVDGFAYYEGLH